MVLDGFRNLTDQEVKKKISDWWEDLEYFKKLKVLLIAYPNLNITKIESQGVADLWRKIPLERKKYFNQGAWKY